MFTNEQKRAYCQRRIGRAYKAGNAQAVLWWGRMLLTFGCLASAEFHAGRTD